MQIKAYTKFSQKFCSSVASDLFCAVLRACMQVSIAQAADYSPAHNRTVFMCKTGRSRSLFSLSLLNRPTALFVFPPSEKPCLGLKFCLFLKFPLAVSGKINTYTHTPLRTKLLVLRMAASSSQWAEAVSFLFETSETGSRLLSAAVTAKPRQEKQVGGLILFENNRKWQPFLGKTGLL